MANINAVGLLKIGNMTSGSGINSIFDGLATTGYHAGVNGWAGVTFDAPKKIKKAIVQSASNGFDASGSTSTITLTLRAKTGSAPTSSSDGVSLASISFTDVNEVNSKELVSNDNLSEFDHCWVQCETGIWSVFAELNFFEVDENNVPTEPLLLSNSATSLMQKSCMDVVPLPQAIVRIPQFNIECETPQDGAFDISYLINVTHRGDLLPTPFLGAVGVGAAIYYQFATSLIDLDSAPLLRPEISTANGINIDDRNPAHYANVGMVTSMKAEKGFYRFGVFMTGHTDGTPQDYVAAVLSEGGRGLNGLRISYDPNGVYINFNAENS